MQNETCCIIGYLDIPADKLDKARHELEREVQNALEDGYTRFLTEFTEGVGILFARCIGGWREKYPGIYWEATLSKLEQAERFSREKWELLSKCDGLKGLCPECKANYPQSVTQYFIERSRRVITLRQGPDDSNTIHAMQQARTMGRELRGIEVY